MSEFSLLTFSVMVMYHYTNCGNSLIILVALDYPSDAQAKARQSKPLHEHFKSRT